MRNKLPGWRHHWRKGCASGILATVCLRCPCSIAFSVIITFLRAVKMNKVVLQSDRIAAASLEKRRTRELQRKERIFNERVRTIGVDIDALDFQVKERRDREDQEAEILNAYATDLLCHDRAACVLESRESRDRRRLEETVQHFRQVFQQPTSRWEFDLNDPDLLKKQEGGQVLQGLAGEDPDWKDRVKRQQEQLREWSLQQQRELELARQQQRQTDQQYDQSRVALDSRTIELQKIQEQRQRALAVATKDFNLTKAVEVAEQRQRQWQQEEEDNIVEIQNQLQTLELNQGPEGSASVLGLARLWLNKGLTAEHQKHIIEFQLQQAEEKRRASMAQRQRELQLEQSRVASARTALLLERQQARTTRRLRRDMGNTNAQLAEAQLQQKKYLEKTLNSNAPDERYFTQFNTSSR
ncbi:RIB43A-like with coiled-coils protein 2 [Anguilla anguilla]|uniref:RIB43A-like with coiled-coils protein 2 n=1 Tax=Anguilla anguilla TaxID=7936 RepID=UPI0015AAD4CF|nr:RIB43A-like with coiled-coils protein 2 [Anguilla anguilla]